MGGSFCRYEQTEECWALTTQEGESEQRLPVLNESRRPWVHVRDQGSGC